jgi:hypothetical protein
MSRAAPLVASRRRSRPTGGAVDQVPRVVRLRGAAFFAAPAATFPAARPVLAAALAVVLAAPAAPLVATPPTAAFAVFAAFAAILRPAVFAVLVVFVVFDAPVLAAAGFTVVSSTAAVGAALRTDSMAFTHDTLRVYVSPAANVRP